MHRVRTAALAASLALLVAAPLANAAGPAARGFMSPGARILGYSLTQLAQAWSLWGFGSADDNPLLAVRCEQSPINDRIWFLPVSLGGEFEATCDIPAGSFLVLFAGGTECSNVEAEPYFGADADDLLACVHETFAPLTFIEVSIDGRTATNLDGNLVITPTTTFPAGNLLSADPALSRTQGYFFVVHPLSVGTHSLRAYDEFDNGSFTAGITYTIKVH